MEKKKIDMDLSVFTDKKDVFDAFRSELAIDFFTVSNLDALYDALTSVSVDTEITVRNFNEYSDKFPDYSMRLASVLANASSADPFLTVIFC